MSKITRQTQKIFALGASNNGQFGSALVGTKVTSNSLPTLMSLSAYNTGWLNAVIGTKNFPALEEFQALSYIETYQISYLLQEGIAEYDTGTTYFQNSIVKKPGTYQLYGSITDTNAGNALTDATKWVFLVDLGAAPVASSFLNASTDTGAANHYVLTPNPAPGAYAEGQVVVLNPAHDNTGSSDIYLNSLAVKSIKMPDGTTDPAAGYIHASSPAVLVYHGGVFILTNPYYVFGTAAFQNVGTAAGDVVQLDVSAKLPAVDGSQLTNLPAQFSEVASASGKLVLGAITIQWGVTGVAGAATITFGTAFSGAPFYVGWTGISPTLGGTNFTTGQSPFVHSITASGMIVSGGTSGYSPYNWIAIGPT